MNRVSKELNLLRELVNHYTEEEDGEDGEDEDDEDNVLGRLRDLTRPPTVKASFYTGKGSPPVSVNWSKLREMTLL